MTNDLFFVINQEHVYIDLELINFNDIPVFFICKSREKYYLALCYDLDEEKYIVIETKTILLLDMLTQKITMRDMYKHVDSFWQIEYGDNPEQDVVYQKQIGELDTSLLPIEGEVYEVFDDDVKEYREKLWTNIVANAVYKSIKKSYSLLSASLENLTNNINQYFETIEKLTLTEPSVAVRSTTCKVELINEKFDCLPNEYVGAENSANDAA